MWTGFWGPDGQVCAIDLRAAKTYCASYRAPEATSRVGWSFLDYSMITEREPSTGQLYVLLMGGPALGVWTVDTAAGVLRFLARGPEKLASESFNQPNGNGDRICDPNENCVDAPHADVTSVGGVEYLVTNIDTAGDPCERDLAALPIGRGIHMVSDRITLLPLAYCSTPYPWPDVHIGCTGRSGACVLSTESAQPSPFGNQIVYLPDFKHAVKVAMHLSAPVGQDTYWYSSRAAPSWDGRLIIFDSNMGQPEEPAVPGFSHERLFYIPVGRWRP